MIPRTAQLCRVLALALLTTPAWSVAQSQQPGNTRPRARDLGVVVGIFPPGEFNAITDVPGVKVGQTTVIQGDSIRSGVTAIVPRTPPRRHCTDFQSGAIEITWLM